MTDGDAFPGRADLDELAGSVDGVARHVSRRVRHMTDKAARRAVRGRLRDAYGVVDALRRGAPGSQAARAAMRAAHDLARELRRDLGLPAVEGLDPDLVRPPASVAGWPMAARRSPLRLPWPVRLDLERHERIGEVAWQSFLKAGRLDAAAEALEARARAAAGLGPAEQARERAPVIEAEDMELARSRRRRPPAT